MVLGGEAGGDAEHVTKAECLVGLVARPRLDHHAQRCHRPVILHRGHGQSVLERGDLERLGLGRHVLGARHRGLGSKLPLCRRLDNKTGGHDLALIASGKEVPIFSIL